ncbi:SH3 domain-containing protein [Aphanothece sacrum]|uniref:FAD dependent oxidoreductase n=1 Tax=Aphanothece sacrum FPU1 TaxID=1920663 RepID=A0A401IK37_APHSA|nr:SH3 domain-containing protein [Aphanothece sacrum]GBF81540.1 FAD dependent oxidoreductase [Aphanothece sacrum FPU1]GBF87003.1 FAD-dependent pyridine nucleotide-disulfide oxidoreductase [Aphanothece sacrum FPU3]
MWKTIIASAIFLGVAILPLKAQVQVGPGCGRTDGYCRRGTGGENPYGRVCTNQRDGRLSMRSGPGQNYQKLTEIPNGRTIAIYEGQYGPDGIYWWQANYNGRGGWVRADYVCNDPQ